MSEKSFCLFKIMISALCTGSKHKTMLEARSGAGPIKAYPRPGAKLKNGSTSSIKGSGLQNKTFHCQICDVHVNSEIQLKQVETLAATFLRCSQSKYKFNNLSSTINHEISGILLLGRNTSTMWRDLCAT